MNEDAIRNLIQSQRDFYERGITREIPFRKSQLKNLFNLIKKYEADILEALYVDLRKPVFEGFMSEIGIIYSELRSAKRKVKSWSRAKLVPGAWLNICAVNKILPEPRGVVLVIGPWNYPFQLLMSPLIGAIAAGNCAILKPSEFSPATSSIVSRIIKDGFDPEYIAVVEGGVEVGQSLVGQKFDHIFYTGGTEIGKKIMKGAAENLTPVTLELGGKSPCIIDESADLDLAAKKIVWGKFWNAGQTCIAPDYLLADSRIKERLVGKITRCIETFWGADPSKTKDYARIINEKHFQRLRNLMNSGKIVIGGKCVESERYISPTVIENTGLDSPIMKEEIFGPLLPVLEFKDIDDCIQKIKLNPKPLALHCFSKDKVFRSRIMREIPFGGGCINDTFLQFTNHKLPFGGVGTSGFGHYHGKFTFDTFSHFKPVVRSLWVNGLWPIYPPYRFFTKLMRKLITWI